MKTRDLPWGRCSRAIRNECSNPCGKYFAHRISRWGYDWCMCEPIERPPEFKSWAAYNRMLTLRLTVEGKLTKKKYQRNPETRTWDVVGYRLQSTPGDHTDEKDFKHII